MSNKVGRVTLLTIDNSDDMSKATAKAGDERGGELGGCHRRQARWQWSSLAAEVERRRSDKPNGRRRRQWEEEAPALPTTAKSGGACGALAREEVWR